MKSVGLFGGSFKPYHTGHHAKLVLALKENDEVILYYTISKRDRAGVVFTKEMSEAIYGIVAPALLGKYGSQLKIKISNPTPVVNMFEEIADVKNGKSKYDKITIYGDTETKDTFISNIIGKRTRKGECKEEKYYGDLYKTEKLQFRLFNPEDKKDLNQLTASLKLSNDKVLIRGTQIREFVQNNNSEGIIKYLPAFLSNDEKSAIVEILFKNNKKQKIQGLPFYAG